jgi:methylation protein EvaC
MSNDHFNSTRACRVCSARIEAFMSFGKQPIANGFLKPGETDKEYFYELKPAFCEKCGMFQIVDQPAAEQMFHGEYAFFSSTSRYMQAHFAKFAQGVMDDHLKGRIDPFVVELGSNDGIMISNFKENGIRHLGVEPSTNVADVARSKGINVINEFFSAELADKIVAQYGYADFLSAANVMCHIPVINSIAAGVKRLLKPDGIFMFEDPYLGAMIEKTSYDQIYDEHVFIFSAISIQNAFARHGLELVDTEPQITHGGSMRYTIAPKGSRRVSERVMQQLTREREQGLDKPETFDRFRRNCEKSRDDLLALLEKLRNDGKRVVGYGATSKSSTVTAYCGIGPQHVEFISDTTPIKQGKLSPGAHIPVKPYADFANNYPDYALLFAWNHGAEIREKESAFTTAGGKWILYVPDVRIES